MTDVRSHETGATARGRLGVQERRALLSGTLGNTIEYYEFATYGLAAALIFPELFFPIADSGVGTILSLGTFIVAFIARPLGGLVFGHFGDRLGRRGTLVVALTMMGLATAGIGLLPTFDQIGIWAPLLLILLRVIQGLSIGGEYSGSILMAVEHARPGLRTFFGALISSGLAWGTLLANGAFLLASQLPDDSFRAWGWRVPFLISIVLVAFCLYIRLKLDESPEFEQAVAAGGAVAAEPSTPVLAVLRQHWRTLLLVILLIPGIGMTYYIATVFSLTYAKSTRLNSDNFLVGIIVAQIVLGIGTPAFGWIADRTGRRREMLLASFLGISVATWIWFTLVSTDDLLWICVGFALFFTPFAAAYAAMPATLAHVFPLTVRFTGLALGHNVGTLIGSATAPLVSVSLLQATGSWVSVAIYLGAGAILSMVAGFFLREKWAHPVYTDDVPDTRTEEPVD